MLDIPLKLITENVKPDIIFKNLKHLFLYLCKYKFIMGYKRLLPKTVYGVHQTIYGTFS